VEGAASALRQAPGTLLSSSHYPAWPRQLVTSKPTPWLPAAAAAPYRSTDCSPPAAPWHVRVSSMHWRRPLRVDYTPAPRPGRASLPTAEAPAAPPELHRGLLVAPVPLFPPRRDSAHAASQRIPAPPGFDTHMPHRSRPPARPPWPQIVVPLPRNGGGGNYVRARRTCPCPACSRNPPPPSSSLTDAAPSLPSPFAL
jgi:hypothetical protein